MKLITEELLDTVTSQAKENSRLRMNYNFHASMDAPIHRLLNALEPGTYLPPHRHHIVCFFHPFNKSFTNNIHPTLPTPAKNMKPIKIINLLGFAGFKGTVAG